jgi:hypothetical protein
MDDFTVHEYRDKTPRNEVAMLRQINDRFPIGQRGYSQCRKATLWDKVMFKTFWARKYFTHKKMVSDGFEYRGGLMVPKKHVTWIPRKYYRRRNV